MKRKSFFIKNPTSENIRIAELNLSIPQGTVDLFSLNENLSFEQIDYSLRYGTLYAAIENSMCYPVPDPELIVNQKITSDVIIRNPLQIQVIPSRSRFPIITTDDSFLFDSNDDADLFKDEIVKPARLLEEELKKTADNIHNIEATIKQANLPDKPIENNFEENYIPPKIIPVPEIKLPIAQTIAFNQTKMKNDILQGYNTCSGFTKNGTQCMKQTKKGKQYCGIHSKKTKMKK